MIGRSKSGFTLVEISLSTAFLATLAIAIAVISSQLAFLSQKGIAINNVNDTSRELVDELTRSITSSTYSTYYNDPDMSGHFEYVYNQTKIGNKPYYGAFCNGYESYIWNTGYALNENNGDDRAIYTGYVNDDGSGEYKVFKLLKVLDVNRSVCAKYYDNTKNDPTRANQFSGGSDPVEIISDDSAGMVLYDMVVHEPSYSQFEKQALYSISFVLGTMSGTVNLDSSTGYCSETAIDFATDFPFCAVNKFNFAARATGGLPNETSS